MRFFRHFFISAILVISSTSASSAEREPVIDVHLHASGIADFGPPPMGMCSPLVAPVWDQRQAYGDHWVGLFKKPACENPVWSPTTQDELKQRTVWELEKYNVYGVVSGPPDRVAEWKAAAPRRVMSGLEFRLGDSISLGDRYSVEEIEALHKQGKLDVLTEVITQYEGILPTDPGLEPYWALAEKLNIPVGIHIGTGPPGAPYLGFQHYRGKMHSPLTIEDVLINHPKLRVYIVHAGYPMIDDLIAAMYVHPQLHVDIGVIAYILPKQEFRRYLHRIVQAGYGERIMFGSDQMIWPETIGLAIAVIKEDPDLSEIQKRNILFNNAARFLRLTPEEIAAMHR
jgi:uncharacterized protein